MATTRDYTTALTPLIQNKTLAELTRTGLSILLVYSTHYGATKAYSLICVPDGVLGFLFGFVTLGSPWCKLLLEIMKVTDSQYSTIILIVLSRLIMQAVGI